MWVEWPCGHVDDIAATEVGELPCPECGNCGWPHRIGPELAELKLSRDGPERLMFTGYEIQVSPYLAGQKRPVLSLGVIYVSPAMWDLIRHADEQELQQLMSNLFPIEIPDLRATMVRELPLRTIRMETGDGRFRGRFL